MKKITSLALLCVLLVGCVFTLASCVFAAGPITIISGEYEADYLAVEYNIEFSPFGGVTLETETILGSEKNYKGKYKVNNETQEITFTWEGDAPVAIPNGTSNFAYGEENGVEYIRIGLITLNAAD